MNPARHTSKPTQDCPAMKLIRKDFLTAQLVEIGLVIQTLQGTYEAAEYLRSRRVNMEVASRALTQPHKRRTWCDWNYPKKR
jgi:hypothetical protein